MNSPLHRRAAFKRAAIACLSASFTGAVIAQPPAGKPPSLPAGPAMAPPSTISVPNAAASTSEVGGRSLEEWIKDIDHPDPSVRERACRVVLQFGVAARKAIPALSDQAGRNLNDLSPQASAIIALAELVPLTPPPAPGGAPDGYTTKAVNALISASKSSQAVIRFRAATALGWIGPPARPAVQELVRMIDDRMSWEIRKAVCFALGTVGRDDQGYPLVAALEALARGVSDRESKGVRLEALQSVLRLGPPLPPANAPQLTASAMVPQLMNALRQRLTAERDKVVLLWVRVAILALDGSRINDKELSVIAKEIKSADPELRSAAVKAFGVMGPAGKSKIQDLIDALPTTSDSALLVDLCQALGRMGKDGERAIPSLTTTMEAHPSDAVGPAARAAIESIKTAADLAKQQPAPAKK